MSNKNLHTAKKAKKDEFYTQLTDIEKELQHYPEQLKDKIIYCNCDDYENSNFYKYFKDNFNKLQLKEVIATGYDINTKQGKYAKYNGFVEYTNNNFNGDFKANIDLLKQADIVVTNPPFSLFREYFKLLVEYDKKFLIIGNMNAITFKEIFPLFKNGKVWWGVSLNGTNCNFIVPEKYEGDNVFVENGVRYGKLNNAIWFTNLEHKKRNEELILYKQYSEECYPKYDNYDAIEVSKVAEIPFDYNGVMGVPITFLYKYNPSQFQIIGFFNNYKPETADVENGQIYGNAVKIATTKSLFRGPVVNGKATYFRILIKKKK
jgi:hypothetical protein